MTLARHTLGNVPDERYTMTRAEMARSYHTWALAHVQTLPGSEVASMLGCDVAELARAGLIVLRDDSETRVPRFQLDADKRLVRPVVAAVNPLLLAERDPWGALAWWVSENPRWRHRRPIEHPDDEQLVALAGALDEDGF